MIRHGNDADVIVIGGGPAGAAAATALAMKGRRVIVLEKERFPRYHIGESLIPYTWFALNRIGMIEKLKQSNFVRKYSVQFVSPEGKVSVPFYFNQHTDHECAQTWQVVRDEFDRMLLDNAQEKGAEVRVSHQAKALLMERGGVVGVGVKDRSTGREYELHAPVTIDATGRDALAMNHYDWRRNDPELRKLAIWTYYQGAKRDPGLDEGATTVAMVPQKGWFWYIPQHDDVVSVGIVAERDYLYRGPRDPDAILQREIDAQPWVKEHVTCGTKLMPAKVTSDYSYRAAHCAADGLVLVGDAFAFLDPVFSSGVFLALHSGVLAADSIDAALAAGDVGAARFEEYGRNLCQGIEAMRKLVYAFYDVGFSWSELFRKHPHLRGDSTDCLIGNLYKDFDPLFTAVAEFAKVPEPLPYGLPFSPAATAWA
jgi:flavin-dependent dehydrogenase